MRLVLLFLILFSVPCHGAVTFLQGKNAVSYSERSIAVVAVDSTTQQELLTGSGKIELYTISNPSINKGAWLKVVDDTAKTGIFLPPGGHYILPSPNNFTWYVIMDSGGSVNINILRCF